MTNSYTGEKLFAAASTLAAANTDIWTRLTDTYTSQLHRLKDDDFDGDLLEQWEAIAVPLRSGKTVAEAIQGLTEGEAKVLAERIIDLAFEVVEAEARREP